MMKIEVEKEIKNVISMLNKWKEAGLLTPAKTGDRQNSTVLYSFAEIKRLVCTIQMKTICEPQ